MTTTGEARERALGYASGFEDASGTKTVPAPGSHRGPDFGWMDFAEAFAKAQDDYNQGRRPMMTNCKDAYRSWTESSGETIFDAIELHRLDLIREARSWIADCFEDVDVAELSDAEVRSGVQRHYEGGWAAFVAATAS